MRARTAVPLLSALVAAGLLVAAPPALAAVAPKPAVLAATGDSLTRAFDVDGSHFLKDAPADSWATGTDTRVGSVLSRFGGGVTAYNDAVTGAKMAALDGQLLSAAAQNADGVTVEMGANDVCTSSASTMTPTATFTSQFDTALKDFTAKQPNATIAVYSIPNIYQLWSTLHTNGSARFTWSLFSECKSMLASSNTETQRQAVLAQEKADNAALAAVCKNYPQCHWDGYAVFNQPFTAGQISTVDYFHPNVSGQSVLAGLAWSNSPWL